MYEARHFQVMISRQKQNKNEGRAEFDSLAWPEKGVAALFS